MKVGGEKKRRKRKAARKAASAEAARPSERRQETKKTFIPGDEIVVVLRYDETLPDRFLGRRGVVVGPMPYQELGDDPEVDPVYLIKHAPSMGRPYETQIYWTEEIENR